MSISEGAPAPDFRLAGSDDQSHTLGDYAGKTLVIYFYPKDNTPGCTKEACGFRDRFGALGQAGVELVGVSKDNLGSHDKFIAEFQLPFVLLSDPTGEMMSAYDAFGEKVKDGKTVVGTTRSTVVIGPDGRVKKHWATVKNAEDHPQEILDFLAGG